MSKQIELLRARRLVPLLLTQTTGAFNDNLFKSAFIMLITYGAAAGPDPGVVAAGAGGALIAPFFLFSATAGSSPIGSSVRDCCRSSKPPNSSPCSAPPLLC
jgi:hypothetical protein